MSFFSPPHPRKKHIPASEVQQPAPEKTPPASWKAAEKTPLLLEKVINDFISATKQLPEQDPNSIELSSKRENVARNFALRWLLNFEKVVEKNPKIMAAPWKT